MAIVVTRRMNRPSREPAMFEEAREQLTQLENKLGQLRRRL
jgi:hypothetical protein